MCLDFNIVGYPMCEMEIFLDTRVGRTVKKEAANGLTECPETVTTCHPPHVAQYGFIVRHRCILRSVASGAKSSPFVPSPPGTGSSNSAFGDSTASRKGRRFSCAGGVLGSRSGDMRGGGYSCPRKIAPLRTTPWRRASVGMTAAIQPRQQVKLSQLRPEVFRSIAAAGCSDAGIGPCGRFFGHPRLDRNQHVGIHGDRRSRTEIASHDAKFSARGRARKWGESLARGADRHPAGDPADLDAHNPLGSNHAGRRPPSVSKAAKWPHRTRPRRRR